MSEDAEIRGVIPNYYAFIMGRLNRIAALEDAGNLTEALECAIQSTKYLPRKLKKQIDEEQKRITKRLRTEAHSNEWFGNMRKKETAAIFQQIAEEEEEGFVDRITTLLDQEHLLTQSYGIPTKARSMGDIQKTVDTARYNSGE
jgi:hypothetical protein